MYAATMSKLTLKVKRALDDAVEASTNSCLTWSQRSYLKKHAWGSCSTIGMLLAYSNWIQYYEDACFESTLLEQFRCIQLSNAIHGKIAAAAVHSMSNLPCSFWQQMPDNCRCIGRGLASCFCYLNNVS